MKLQLNMVNKHIEIAFYHHLLNANFYFVCRQLQDNIFGDVVGDVVGEAPVKYLIKDRQ